VTAIVVAIGLVAIGLGMLGCAKPEPPPAKNPDELLTQLKDDRARIDQTTDAMMQRIDKFNSSRKPGEQTIQFSEVFNQDLSPEQRDVLNSMVAQEADISYKALLQKIIADRDTIQGLQDNVARLEQTLPDSFVVARRGDRQHDLAMAYLTQDSKLDEAKAKVLLSQVDQTDELLPGNKVWFFYDPKQDTFRTYVTQGEASKTPLAVRRANQRALTQERDTFKVESVTFKGERDVAQAEVASLQEIKTGLESDIASLTQTKYELESNVSRLSNDIALRENSLYFHAGNEKQLADQGVLSSVLKRVRDVKGLEYDESLDLRQGTTITLIPESYGLDEIHNVRLLPPIYQEGRDFTVETVEDHSSARLVILDPEIFRGKEVLVSIRG
jgi:predicted  nucleic acid-binding Zn-ribbon protein